MPKATLWAPCGISKQNMSDLSHEESHTGVAAASSILSRTLSQYRCECLPAHLSFGRSIASLSKGLLADILLTKWFDRAEGDILRPLLTPPKKPIGHCCTSLACE